MAAPDAAAAPPPELLARAVAVLRGGGLVAFPTETVYGLGADADDAGAVRAIFAAKGRPAAHPLIVHVAHPQAAAAWARALPAPATRLMERFWPGPLTLILERSARAGDAVTGGQDRVGLRCPSHPWARALLQALGAARGDAAAAIAAPSANRYGRISPTSAAHVRADLGEKPRGRVDLILDGGDCPLGIESTIVDFDAGAARILRPGSISIEQIRSVLGTDVRRAAEDEDAPRAPGRVRGHYAPGKPLELLDAAQLPARIAALGPAAVAVLAGRAALAGMEAADLALFMEAAGDPAAYAHQLYAHLHRFDASAAQVLLVARPPRGADWVAVLDRLVRAASGSAGPLGDAD
jgi:L-threonylcarbamoyladenylate synthase